MTGVIWKSVTRDEYFSIVSKGTPKYYRVGFADGQETYELGTLPRELPTKRGAILVPTAEWLERHNGEDWDVIEYKPDAAFVYNGADWVSLEEAEQPDIVPLVEVQDALDTGGTIMFEGIDD